ncbi:hypothetical protein RF11_15621 [Thelohanellus kitauei]|uniref:Uncharacterized protein n=1 Tax=Thelohanellus kitauei TaxID=669202 RepID=A0A0C2J7Y3_THEKT|nr:hypothetical protein RF11_15621 [Thelohanellus kitauei]
MSYTGVSLETKKNPQEDIVQQIEDLEDLALLMSWSDEKKVYVLKCSGKFIETLKDFTNFMQAKLRDFSDCINIGAYQMDCLKTFNCKLPWYPAIAIVINKILKELQVDLRRPLPKNSSSILKRVYRRGINANGLGQYESNQSFVGAASENADLKEFISLIKLQLKTNAKGKDADRFNWRKRV